MGGTQSKKVCGEEKYFVLGRLEQPRQDKKSLVPAQRFQRTNQFQQSAGANPLYSLCCEQ